MWVLRDQLSHDHLRSGANDTELKWLMCDCKWVRGKNTDKLML